jgi:hypothetical protein
VTDTRRLRGAVAAASLHANPPQNPTVRQQFAGAEDAAEEIVPGYVSGVGTDAATGAAFDGAGEWLAAQGEAGARAPDMAQAVGETSPRTRGSSPPVSASGSRPTRPSVGAWSA